MKELIFFLSLIFAPTPALADAACEERVRDCEGLVQQADLVINAQANLIDELNASNNQLQKYIEIKDEQLAQEKAWYRQPSVIGPLTFILGVVVGVQAAK